MDGFQIVGIPATLRGTPQIKVSFTITERQIPISARDLRRKADLERGRPSDDRAQEHLANLAILIGNGGDLENLISTHNRRYNAKR